MMDDLNGDGALYALKSGVSGALLPPGGPVKRCVCGVLVGGRGVSTVYLSTYVNAALY